ncbi:MAG TPA: hypothetical protein VGT78_06120 [Rhizomicrobium sp.]|nr:hypothetical protein [Rhizomicrobium sp.]
MAARIVILSAVAAIALAGCAGAQVQAPPGVVDKSSPGYTQGYTDGCAASNQQARKQHTGPLKDDNMYSSNASYYAGWNEAFKACEDKVTPSALPIPGNSVIM